MDTKELAESVKRLREIYACHNGADPHELMYAVNALVQLMGEMHQPIKYGAEYKFGDGDITRMFEQALAKSAPIAELAKGE